MATRYLAVFDPSGQWQVIDTENKNKIVDTGNRADMLVIAAHLNEETTEEACLERKVV